MKIVVLDGYTLNPGDNPWTEVEKLGDLTVHDRTPAEQILNRSGGADILLTNKTPLSAETIAKLDSLKCICVLATGFNVVDIVEAKKRSIPVCNIPVYGTNSVAQFTFALLLELCHRVGLHDEAVKAGEWISCPDFSFWKVPLIELAGQKMGIVGFGRIGRHVGELAHAFGMEVLAADEIEVNPPDYAPFAWKSIEALFAEADVISLHCPQTASNAGFVNRELLSTTKKGAIFLNDSRGGLMVEQDLADALNSGQLGGAAVDVISSEPMSPDNPLLKARNCLVTPHMAWATLAARNRLMQTTADNIAAFQKGKPTNVVNP